MAFGKPEQIDKVVRSPKKFSKRFEGLYTTPGYRKEIKKHTKRRRRKLEKKLLDDAPIKNEYYGWSL